MSEQERITNGIQGTGEAAPLSPHRAFVVQFRSRAGLEHEIFRGRVEHIVSGQAARFDSLEGLVAFLTRVLTAVEEVPPERPP